MFAAAACSLALLGAAAVAGDDDDHAEHMKMSPKMADARKEVDVPSPMRVKMLANMRAHAETMADVVAALSKGDGEGAAKIAETRLGVASPGAAACKPNAKSGELGDMAAMMAKHMPDEMRAMGLAMHEQASKFAEAAGKVKPGGDLRPALAELSQVMQACNACHAAYRLE
jgi:hypothetical protein